MLLLRARWGRSHSRHVTLPQGISCFLDEWGPRIRCGLVDEQLQRLRSTLSDKPPFCSGILPLSPENFILFYGKDSHARRVDLLNASEDDLARLTEACDPATFGVAQQDVFDETYRKALKLDSANFAVKLDAASSGLLEIIRVGLLEEHEETKAISAELYKLNVYGKGSFFKAHKDTPRGETMFGSLVITFPTPHDGGALALRHNDKEWTIDASHALSNQQRPCVAYVAFYSDVEHEVALITSGYRVTITYNLYFAEHPPSIAATAIPQLSTHESELRAVFQSLLGDPTFLPEGGHLGFGLRHQYPIPIVPSRWKKNAPDVLKDLARCLKGSDAVLSAVCRDLGLDASLKMIFKDKEKLLLVMCDRAVNLKDDGQVESCLYWHLEQCYGGQAVGYLEDARYRRDYYANEGRRNQSSIYRFLG
ncbi:hypothetical protein A0H81_08870 [Grifola frondosa]|uniref:Prolyl 4-hydroxylase alpha subunit Fe(2+) 2OG dioxygenase domain-containing protein n=1 Tax=Grifola frondosa TaxID=5627 RepID=A0A1C7M409_GRIFR|nr:hypothetical protein A0H81_08870 [Grifola frondosa]